MTRDCEVKAEKTRETVVLSGGVIRAFERAEVAVAFCRLVIAKKVLTAELNRLMFSVSHRRYLQVVERLERVSPGIDRFIRR
jgi:hypothetical protein